MKKSNNSNSIFILVAILLTLIIIGSVFYLLEKSEISGHVSASEETSSKINDYTEKVFESGDVVAMAAPIENPLAEGFVDTYLNSDSLEVPVYWYFERVHIESLFTPMPDGDSVIQIRFYSGIDSTLQNNRKLTLIAVPVFGVAGFDKSQRMYEFATTCPKVCPGALPTSEQFLTPAQNTKVYRGFEFSKLQVLSCFGSNDNFLRVSAVWESNGMMTIGLCGIQVINGKFENQIVGACTEDSPAVKSIGQAYTNGDDFPYQ